MEKVKKFVREVKLNYYNWNKSIKSGIDKMKLPVNSIFKRAAKYMLLVSTIDDILEITKHDKFFYRKAEEAEGKKRDNYKKNFAFFNKDTLNIDLNAKPLFDYVNRINSIQNDEFAICYHDGKMYIDKKYLETEVN